MTGRAATAAAWTGLALEAAALCLLVAPETAAIGLALAAVVLAVYTAALAVGIANGRRVACRCFGNDGEMMGPSHLLRNGLLTLAAAAGVLVAADAGWPASGQDVVVIGAGLFAGWLCTRWDDVAFLLGAALRDPLPTARSPR